MGTPRTAVLISDRGPWVWCSTARLKPICPEIRSGDTTGRHILWQESTQGWLYVWYMEGITKLGGSYLSPNKIDPTWRMVGIGLLD